jgi:hypothetical protein
MKSRAVIIGLVVGGAVLLLLYYFYNSDRNKYQWYQSFKSDSKQPYGTMFVRQMLESYRKDGTFTENKKWPFHELVEKEDFSDGDSDYVLIGESAHFDDDDLDAMVEFLRAGNDVFIATVDPPTKLLELVYESNCETTISYEYEVDPVLYANFYHPRFKKEKHYEFRYRMGAEDFPYYWRSLSGKSVCDTLVGFTPLGYQQEQQVNFMRIDEGAGRLYLHTAPLMFTNYFMTKEDKMEYASVVFSHLSGKNMVWDEVSKLPFSDLENPYDSPLYYIMQQPALKYAWWMLLVGAILYIIFASKRTQRVVPVLETKTNTSLEFLNVISSLHYQNPNHLDMARKKMKYFLYFIRARYGINTQTFTEEHVKRLSEKSKTDVADIQVIYDRYKVIESYSISNDEPERLVGLYQAIDKFYKNCK